MPLHDCFGLISAICDNNADLIAENHDRPVVLTSRFGGTNIEPKPFTTPRKLMQLSVEAIKRLQNSPCYLCGDGDVSRGYDRVDSEGHYVDDNTRSCCWPCNKMKKDYDLIAFLQHLVRMRDHFDMDAAPAIVEMTPENQARDNSNMVSTSRKRLPPTQWVIGEHFHPLIIHDIQKAGEAVAKYKSAAEFGRGIGHSTPLLLLRENKLLKGRYDVEEVSKDAWQGVQITTESQKTFEDEYKYGKIQSAPRLQPPTLPDSFVRVERLLPRKGSVVVTEWQTKKAVASYPRFKDMQDSLGFNVSQLLKQTGSGLLYNIWDVQPAVNHISKDNTSFEEEVAKYHQTRNTHRHTAKM